MRESLELRTLREGSILYIYLHSRQGHAVVLYDYHFEPVIQNLSLNDFLQLRSLSRRLTRKQPDRCRN